jgi:hypothetical protein
MLDVSSCLAVEAAAGQTWLRISGSKFEIRISKSETNPNYQNTNVQNSSARALPCNAPSSIGKITVCFGHSNFGSSDLFRISCFGFRRKGRNLAEMLSGFRHSITNATAAALSCELGQCQNWEVNGIEVVSQIKDQGKAGASELGFVPRSVWLLRGE